MLKKRFKRVFMKTLAEEVKTVHARATIRINALMDMDACILHGANVYGDCVMVPADSVEPVVLEKDVKPGHPYVGLYVELRDKSGHLYACTYVSEGYVQDATRKICIQDAKQLCDSYIQRISEDIAQTYIEEKENKNHD